MGIAVLTLLVVAILLVAAAWIRYEFAEGSRPAETGDGTGGIAGHFRRFAARHDPVILSLGSIGMLVAVGTVLLSPVRGMADNGDWERLLYQLNLRAVPGQHLTSGFLNQQVMMVSSRSQLPIPHVVSSSNDLFGYYYHYVSSELGLMRLAVFFHGITGSSLIDIRWVGAVNLLPLMGGLAALIIATRPLTPWIRRLVVLLLLVAFLDPGYLLYYNSFFSEPSALGFMLLAVGAGLSVVSSRHARWAFAVFVLASVGYALAKTDDALPSLFLILLAVPLGWHAFGGTWRDRRTQLAVAGGVTVMGAAVVWGFASELQYFTLIHEYDAVFYGLLPHTADKAGLLRTLGVPERLARYSGYEAFDRGNSAFVAPFIHDAYFQRMSVGKLLGYDLGHPGAITTAINYASAQAPNLRLDSYLSNVTTGFAPWAPNTPWTVVHRDLLPHDPGILAVPIVTLAGAIAWGRSRLRSRIGLPALMFAALALASFIALLQPPLVSGEEELVKHEFQFNVLSDLCLIALIAAACVWGTRRRPAISSGESVPRPAHTSVAIVEGAASRDPADSANLAGDDAHPKPHISCPVCDATIALAPEVDRRGRRVTTCEHCGYVLVLGAAPIR